MKASGGLNDWSVKREVGGGMEWGKEAKGVRWDVKWKEIRKRK